MAEDIAPSFATDRPLTARDDDRLNRAAFAERVASVLLDLPAGASLVVGLHGPWGDGKTTVLNLMRVDLDASSRVAVVDFNPWRFTDEGAMLAGFFRELARVIRAKLSTKGEEVAGWVEKVGKYAALLDKRFGSAAEIAKEVADVGLEELRERLFAALGEAEKRLVVLIDDIDRLDRSETQTLFRLIKACADFPNVSYVLAFDDTAVAKSLGERYGGGDEQAGRAFLEKIIQIPLKLPVAAKEDLRGLCFEQVEQSLSASEVELTRDEIGEFVAGFDRGAAVRLTTPRAAKRYGNALMFALPMLKGEVNTVDLFLIEALRAFFPEVHEIIRQNQGEFCGVEDRYGGNRANQQGAELLKPVLEAMDEAEAKAAKSLIVDLFPRLSSSFGHGGYGSDWLARWSRERRVSAPEYCPRYFTYAVARQDIADAEVADLVRLASEGDGDAVRGALATHLDSGRAQRLIEKLRGVATTLDPKASVAIAVSIAGPAHKIPNPPSLFGFTAPPAQAAMLVSQLLAQVEAGDKRVAIAKQIMEACDPLWFGVECLRWCHVTDNPDKLDHNTLTEDELAEVRLTLVGRIKARSEAGDALFDPEVQQEKSLLFEWWRAEGREPVESHLLGVFASDPGQICKFLESQAPLAHGMNEVMPHVGSLDGDQLKNIKLIIDLRTLAALIREHCDGDFENPTFHPSSEKPVAERLAEQFIFVFDKWQQEGEPGAEDETERGKEVAGE